MSNIDHHIVHVVKNKVVVTNNDLLLWGHKSNSVFILQKQAIRTIVGVYEYLVHTTHIFKSEFEDLWISSIYLLLDYREKQICVMHYLWEFSQSQNYEFWKRKFEYHETIHITNLTQLLASLHHTSNCYCIINAINISM